LGAGVNVKVKNFNESESATCIEIAILLKSSGFKTYIVVPFLSLLTVFVFPIVLYWSKRLQGSFFYSRADSLQNATHIYIVGQGKQNKL